MGDQHPTKGGFVEQKKKGFWGKKGENPLTKKGWGGGTKGFFSSLGGPHGWGGHTPLLKPPRVPGGRSHAGWRKFFPTQHPFFVPGALKPPFSLFFFGPKKSPKQTTTTPLLGWEPLDTPPLFFPPPCWLEKRLCLAVSLATFYSATPRVVFCFHPWDCRYYQAKMVKITLSCLLLVLACSPIFPPL